MTCTIYRLHALTFFVLLGLSFENETMSTGSVESKIAAIQLLHNKEIILDWYAVSISKGLTFAKLFEDVCNVSKMGSGPGARFKREFSPSKDTYTSCYVRSGKSYEVEVSWELPITDTLPSFDASHIIFKSRDITVEKQSVNAFTQLMEGQRTLLQNKYKYPEEYGQRPVTRRDWKLKNDFIDLLKEKGLGFLNGEEKTSGKATVNAVCDCLFYILPHLGTLSSRCITLHEFFQPFYNRDDLSQDYNDPIKYKNKVKPLDSKTLSEHVQNLFKCLLFPSVAIPRFATLKDAILHLANSLSKQVEYMGKQNDRVMTIHNLPHPTRTPDGGISTRLRHIPGRPRDPILCDRYADLENALLNESEYTPVFVGDFCSLDRKKIYFYMKDIQFPFDVTLYTYSGGGPNESLHFVWRCDRVLDLQKSNKVIHLIEKDIPIYHTRFMQKEFKSKFGLISKAHPAVLGEMYRFLTGDSSALPNKLSKDVHTKLLVAIDSGNPNIAFDMRTVHDKGCTKFDRFFEEVDKFINEFELNAVDDRRHGLISHLSVAMSVNDLHNQVSARVPEDTNIPSVEWLRLQFMPKNPSLAAAVQYTGRFPLKFRVQSRQFNAYHVDAHYASALQKYVKEFSVKYRNDCVLLSVDDKNHIPVGEPGNPIATIYRSKKSVAHANIPHVATDHDTASKCKITPSVIFLIDVPETLSGDFYNGQVSVTLKDTKFQPSNPIRHVAEIRKFLGLMGKLGKPIQIIFSDGGPDHRLTYPSVKLSLIALFLLADIDYLLAVRTAPHQSYRNWVERIMSILNLGLQTVATERKTMPQEYENKMKKMNTMSSIRTSAEKDSDFKDALLTSMQPVLQTINEIFERLSLKGKNFLTGEPATDVLFDELWNAIHDLDPTVERTDTQTKQLEKRKSLKQFMDHCVTSRKYFFLVKKCGSADCAICKKPRLDPEVFSSLKPFPDPMPGNDEKFRPFEDVYGTVTTEEHCPSLQSSASTKQHDDLLCKMTAETVRDFICCLDCGKPRCIYTPKKLTVQHQQQLQVLKEECVFTCGGVLIPPDHPLNTVGFVEPNTTCRTPVATHYFGSRTSFPSVCFNCGCSSPDEISDSLKKCFQSVHPVCSECRKDGVYERTRGNRDLKRKREH